jgi:thiol-disulfide isomerase/thioredoxin
MRRALVCVLLALTAGCARGTTGSPKASPHASPLAAGAITKATPESFQRVLRSMRGTPVVVNYWASWCGPCAQEMPRLVKAAARYKGRVRFLGVDVEDVASSARDFARQYQMSFPSLADPLGQIRHAQKVVGLPTTQFYRADGQLAFLHAGEIHDDQLETKLRELVRVGTPKA